MADDDFPDNSDLSISSLGYELLDALIEDFKQTVMDRLWEHLRNEGKTLAGVEDVEAAWKAALAEMRWVEAQRDGEGDTEPDAEEMRFLNTWEEVDDA